MPLLLIQLYRMLDPHSASLFLPFLAAIMMVGVLMPVLATAFGLGFRLARVDALGRNVIAITSAAYAFILVLLTVIPVRTQAVLFNLPATQEAQRQAFFANILLPVGAVIVILFALPLAVAYSTARITKESS